MSNTQLMIALEVKLARHQFSLMIEMLTEIIEHINLPDDTYQKCCYIAEEGTKMIHRFDAIDRKMIENCNDYLYFKKELHILLEQLKEGKST